MNFFKIWNGSHNEFHSIGLTGFNKNAVSNLIFSLRVKSVLINIKKNIYIILVPTFIKNNNTNCILTWILIITITVAIIRAHTENKNFSLIKLFPDHTMVNWTIFLLWNNIELIQYWTRLSLQNYINFHWKSRTLLKEKSIYKYFYDNPHTIEVFPNSKPNR